MILNILGLIVMALVALFLAWLTVRAVRARHLIVRIPGTLVAGLLTLIVGALTVIAAIGLVKLGTARTNYTYIIQGLPATGSASKDVLDHGQRLAIICSGCHAATEGQFPLSGSADNFLAGGGPPLGVMYAPNLTPGGPIKDWTDAQVARAIREGVDTQGHQLVIMPSASFHGMSDSDVEALIAFLRSQPAVNRDLPQRNLNLVAAAFIGAGLFPTSAQPPITQPVTAPQEGTADYGKYLVAIYGCHDCHGPALAGGTPGGFAPVGPNLTVLVPKWSEADFIKTIRTGVEPTSHKLDPSAMPWKLVSAATTDQNLKDIYAYVHALPVK